jgi:hypothetical protein
MEGRDGMTSTTARAPGEGVKRSAGSAFGQEQVVGVIALVLLVIFALVLPGFATTQNILGLVRSISLLGILARKRRVVAKAESKVCRDIPEPHRSPDARALRTDLLRAWRDGEPAQGMSGRPFRRPHVRRDNAANQLRLWFASFAYVLLSTLKLAHTQFAEATCGTIQLKLVKLGALVKLSARRIKFSLAGACRWADEWRAWRRLVWRAFVPLDASPLRKTNAAPIPRPTGDTKHRQTAPRNPAPQTNLSTTRLHPILFKHGQIGETGLRNAG